MCQDGKARTSVKHPIKSNCNMVLKRFGRITQNNCLFQAIRQAYGLHRDTIYAKYKKPESKLIKEHLGIDYDQQVAPEQVSDTFEWYREHYGLPETPHYQLIDDKGELLEGNSSPDQSPDCRVFMYKNGHYFLTDTEVSEPKPKKAKLPHKQDNGNRPTVEANWKNPNRNIVKMFLSYNEDRFSPKKYLYCVLDEQNNKYLCQWNGEREYLLLEEMLDKVDNNQRISFIVNQSDQLFDELKNLLKRQGHDPHNPKNPYVLSHNHWTLINPERYSRTPMPKDLQSPEEQLDFIATTLDKVAKCFWEVTHQNLVNTKFSNIATQAYRDWIRTLRFQQEIPKDKLYDAITEATYGARVYPTKSHFRSALYGKENLTYQKVLESNDFLVTLDICSCYGSAMAGFEEMKVHYPHVTSDPSSFAQFYTDGAERFDPDKLGSGVFLIKYTPPTNIRHPALPGRNNRSVTWNLLPNSDPRFYWDVDIQNALESGYKIEFLGDCWVWKCRKTGVFRDFVHRWMDKKSQAQTDGDKTLYKFARMMPNSLYGKLGQNIRRKVTKECKTASEITEFRKNHVAVSWSEDCNEHSATLTGIPRSLDPRSENNKPKQLYSLILAYSRRIMLMYLKKIDPTLKSRICYNTNTDSLMVSGEHYKSLQDQGLVLPKNEARLGYLSNDNKNDALIIDLKIRRINQYEFTYILPDGTIETDSKHTGFQKQKIPQGLFDHPSDIKDMTYLDGEWYPLGYKA